jgi:hypothetical protein
MTMQATRPNRMKAVENAGIGTRFEIAERSNDMVTMMERPTMAEPAAEPAHAHPSLATVLSETTNTGDEVIYIGRNTWYTGVIEDNGSVAVQVNFDSTPCSEMAAFLKAITPRTRAVVLASEKSSGQSLPREVMATLMRMLTTASNILGRRVYLISDEDGGESPLEREEYSSVASLYPFTVVSSTNSAAQSVGVINQF